MKSVLKTYGGQGMLMPRLLKLYPKRELYDHFVDAFVGGGSMLLAHDPDGKAEVVNDLCGPLSNFWAVLADPASFEKLRRVAEATPFSEEVFRLSVQVLREAKNPTGGDGPLRPSAVLAAHAYFVVARMSMAGRLKKAGFSPVTKTRLRRGMQEQVAGWLSAVDGLAEVHDRLRRVLILNRDGIELAADWAGHGRAFLVLDPPWHSETRTTDDVYEHEFTDGQHDALAAAVANANAKVLLLGRDNEHYKKHLPHWHRHEFDVAAHSAGGKAKARQKTVAWTNYEVP
jgi:DNA adenine methylase